MKKLLFVILFLFISCTPVIIKDNLYKEGEVLSYYRGDLIETTPVKYFFYSANALQQIRDISDAETNGRILFSPHENYENVYTIRWYNERKQIIKELTIELYRPIAPK